VRKFRAESLPKARCSQMFANQTVFVVFKSEVDMPTFR
jgi:hypothetical protein